MRRIEENFENDVSRDSRTRLRIGRHVVRARGWLRENVFVVAGGIFAIIVVAAVTALTVNYSGRATPGTTIAGTNVSGQNALAIRNSINGIENKIQLTFSYRGKTVVAHSSDLGVQVDIEKTTDRALLAEKNWLNRVNVFAKRNIELVATIDKTQIEKFLDASFPDLIAAPPQNAAVVYDKKLQKFVTQKSVSGKVIDMDKIYGIVSDIVKTPRAALSDVPIIESKAAVSDEQAESAVDFVNARIAARINLQVDGKTIYFPDPIDVANWANFTEKNGELSVAFDKAKIADFVKNVVTKYVPNKPTPETDIAGADGSVLKVISAGAPGRVVTNADAAADKVFASLNNGDGADIALETTTQNAPAKKVVAADNHWIEANLSDFSVKLYDGQNVAWQTTDTSHGKPSTPTITGLFTVFEKTGGNDDGASDYQDAAAGTNTRNPHGGVCMPNPGGASAQLCSIHYVTYWGAGGYAFHEAWWLLSGHQGPRTEISHGCINMFKADAKKVYDFASIGTPVWVHV